MCDDCHEETALEADKRYASRGTYDREKDPDTAGYCMLSQANRYRAEVSIGAYHAGYAPHQVAAVEELTAAIVDDEFLWASVSENYARKHEDEAQKLFKADRIKYPPRNRPNVGYIETRLEYWSVVMRLTHGFTVKTDADYQADVTARMVEEELHRLTLRRQATINGMVTHAPAQPAERELEPA